MQGSTSVCEKRWQTWWNVDVGSPVCHLATWEAKTQLWKLDFLVWFRSPTPAPIGIDEAAPISALTVPVHLVCPRGVQGGATVISSFLRGCGEEMAAEKSGGDVDGQLVDRVVITIAPTFLQGYNVLSTQAGAGGGGGQSAAAAAAATAAGGTGSGATAPVAASPGGHGDRAVHTSGAWAWRRISPDKKMKYYVEIRASGTEKKSLASRSTCEGQLLAAATTKSALLTRHCPCAFLLFRVRRRVFMCVLRLLATASPFTLLFLLVRPTRGCRSLPPGFPLPLLDVGYVRLGQDLVVVGAPARCGDST